MDIGTIFQARNFLNARAVPKSPMKDVNASEDLLLKYSDALLLASFDEYVKTNDIRIKDTGSDEKNKVLMEEILEDFVDQYVIPEVIMLRFSYMPNQKLFTLHYHNNTGWL